MPDQEPDQSAQGATGHADPDSSPDTTNPDGSTKSRTRKQSINATKPNPFSELQKQIDKLNAQLAQKDNEQHMLAQKYNKLNTQHSTLQSDLQATSSNYLQLQGDIHDIHVKNNELIHQLQDNDALKKQLQDDEDKKQALDRRHRIRIMGAFHALFQTGKDMVYELLSEQGLNMNNAPNEILEVMIHSTEISLAVQDRNIRAELAKIQKPFVSQNNLSSTVTSSVASSTVSTNISNPTSTITSSVTQQPIMSQTPN
ncbi:unnamed protein product, partial [Rotaria socialis]